MFDFIRSHQRLMQILLLLLILPSFAFFGIQGLEQYRTNSSGLATVAGQPVTQDEVDQLMRQQMERMQQMLGPNFDPKMFDTPEARQTALNTLIAQHVLQTEVVKQRMVVTDSQVSDEIRNIPAIKALYKPDGSLDVEAYDRLLASVGLSRDQLFAQTRNNLMMQEMTRTIPNSVLLPKPAVERLSMLLNQTREVANQLFAPTAYIDKVSLAPDAVKKYYDTHAAEFESPESLSVQYVVLDQAAVAAHVQVTPAEIEAFYKAPANQARFVIPEQRRASHILIAVAKDATPAERDKAKAKAQDILAKVRAKPADFASLAKQYSDDPGSAERGGDLDYAPAGNYVKQFSDALFALKQDQISDLVETEFGYHIIMMTGLKPGSVRPLDQAKPEIEAELRKQKATAAFSQAVDDFSNMVFDQADSLKPVADKLGLTIQTADAVTRTPAPGSTAPVNDKRVIDALFSDDVLKAKHNTPAIEVAPSVLVSARVSADHPAALKPFEQVKDAIAKQLTEQSAKQLARDAGAARLAELQKTPNDTGFSAPIALVRTAPGKVSASAVKAIFAADASKLPAFVGVEESDGNYVIYRIDSVSGSAANTDKQSQDIARQLATQAGELEFSSYLEGLKKRNKVKLENPPAATSDGTSTSSASVN
jgi:peptidyl-prolyl cis-trans isomerase D